MNHEALGTIRVMRTIGMMGEIVGKAASICIKNNCLPRDVYAQYLDELKELAEQPGVARREKPGDPVNPNAALPYDPNQTGGRAKPHRRAAEGAAGAGLDPKKLPGLVIDDSAAKLNGEWSSGAGLPGFVGTAYRYTSGGKGKSAQFNFKVATEGKYEVRFLHSAHENRADKVTIKVVSADGEKSVVVNQKVKGTLDNGFVTLGTYSFNPTTEGSVIVLTDDATGNVSIDAVQVLPVK